MLFTQIGEKIWVSMPYISDFAYMQVSKKHLSAAFPLKVKTITIHKGEYSTDFGVAHLVSFKNLCYGVTLSQKHASASGHVLLHLSVHTVILPRRFSNLKER